MLLNLKKINKKYIGTFLVCFAASLWGFDAIVLTPRLYHLKVAFVVFAVHCLPFLVMSIFIGKREMKNIAALPKKDIVFYFLVALFGGCVGTLSIVKSLFLVNFPTSYSCNLTSESTAYICIDTGKNSFKRKTWEEFFKLGYFCIDRGIYNDI